MGFIQPDFIQSHFIYTSTMKVLLSFILLSLSWVACMGWTGDIVFEDNFDGSSLDLNKWEYQEGCGTEYGSGNLQCYTRNNVRLDNGNLVIEARRQNMEDKEYTSGRIRQRNRGYVYGAYVTKARMPRGDHLWPGLWLLPIDNYCRYEEIDIAEYRGQVGEARNLEMAGHWGRSWDALTSKGIRYTTPYDLSADFHEYALLWLPSRLEWYIDNEMVYSVSLTDGYFNSNINKLPCRGSLNPFDEESNLIYNIAVGGHFFDEFPIFNPDTWTKPTLEIDWVRIYQE